MKINWKEYCSSCKKFHIMTNEACPDCGIHVTTQPVSEKIKCRANYRCDGCDAYLDHLK